MRLLLIACLLAAASPPEVISGDAPIVTALHPSTDCVPENLLRFHLSFSEPIARGDLRPSVSITDSDGRDIVSPFLNLNIELWSPDQTKVTLLLDPGRIKRGVGPNVSEGTPLASGERYSIVASAPLKSAANGHVIEAFEKEFCVLLAERRRLTVDSWSVNSVRAGSMDTLIISFDRLMDFGSASGRIAVTNNNGVPVAGTFRLGENNTSIEFHPSNPWNRIDYKVFAHESLEDAAGNRFSAAFDRETVAEPTASETPSLAFAPVEAL